jgi:hypothetical protein
LLSFSSFTPVEDIVCRDSSSPHQHIEREASEQASKQASKQLCLALSPQVTFSGRTQPFWLHNTNDTHDTTQLSHPTPSSLFSLLADQSSSGLYVQRHGERGVKE